METAEASAGEGASQATSTARATAVLVCGLMLLGAIPLDVMLPSFPALAERFGSSVQSMSLSVSVFSMAFAISQLFAGPISDRIGRRRLLVHALAIASLATLGMMF